MTEISLQPNNRPGPVALWKGETEYPAMPKRGPYRKLAKKPPPKWRRTYLQEWRIYRGHTLEDLADLAQLSTGTVNDIEKGDVGYSAESLQALADALKVSRGTLLDESPPTKR